MHNLQMQNVDVMSLALLANRQAAAN